MTPIEKAERARALLNDAVLEEAFESVCTNAIKQFENSAPADREARDIAHADLQAVKRVRAALKALSKPTIRKGQET